MSKRDDASSVKWLIDEGFLPSAIANYLVLLGNKTPKEIFTLEEAILWFDIKNVSKSSAKFDLDKLRFINKKHLETIDDMRLSKILGFADTDIGKLGKIYLEEASTLNEIKSKIKPFFEAKTASKGLEKEFTKIKACIKGAPFYENFEDFKIYISEQTGLKEENLTKVLRNILTGRNDGPSLSSLYPLIKNYLGEIIK